MIREQLYKLVDGEYVPVPSEGYPKITMPIGCMTEVVTERDVDFILNNYNFLNLEWKNDLETTRLQVPETLRRGRFWITYTKDEEIVTERYIGTDMLAKVEETWKDSQYWQLMDFDILLKGILNAVEYVFNNLDKYPEFELLLVDTVKEVFKNINRYQQLGNLITNIIQDIFEHINDIKYADLKALIESQIIEGLRSILNDLDNIANRNLKNSITNMIADAVRNIFANIDDYPNLVSLLDELISGHIVILLLLGGFQEFNGDIDRSAYTEYLLNGELLNLLYDMRKNINEGQHLNKVILVQMENDNTIYPVSYKIQHITDYTSTSNRFIDIIELCGVVSGFDQSDYDIRYVGNIEPNTDVIKCHIKCTQNAAGTSYLTGTYVPIKYSMANVVTNRNVKADDIVTLDATGHISSTIINDYDKVQRKRYIAYFTGNFVAIDETQYYKNSTETLDSIIIEWDELNMEDDPTVIACHYMIDCKLSATGVQNIQLPEGVNWANNDIPSEAGRYQISILDGIASYLFVSNS